MAEVIALSYRRYGLAEDPAVFLSRLRAEGAVWSPMNAGRLVIGPVVDRVRESMGEHWLDVLFAVAIAEPVEHWTFAHATLRAWLDYRAGRIDRDHYRQRLVECAEDGKSQFLRLDRQQKERGADA